MSSEDKLTFQCPACQSTLKVPAQLAGVRGPCPQCGTDIIAPNPAIRSAAQVVAAPQLAGVGAGYGGGESYAPPVYPEPAPMVSMPAAADNPWETLAASGQDASGHGELNLGAALAAPPFPATARETAPNWSQPTVGQTVLAPPSLPSFAPPSQAAESSPVHAGFSAPVAAPGFGGAGDPFAPQAGPAGFQGAPTVQSPGEGGVAFASPSLFPSAPAPGQPAAERVTRVKKRRRDGESGKADKASRLPLVLGALGFVALAAAGAFFFVPGLKDKILGKSEPLAVSVDTAIPVPRKQVPAAGTAKEPEGSAAIASPSDPLTGVGGAASGTALPVDPEAASKPAPDFGLGDPPAPEPAEVRRASPVPPQESGETPVPPQPEAAAAGADPDSAKGDSKASPEDVAAARTILENFIKATSIEERLSYSQPAPNIEEQMRAYYAKHPASVTPVQINYTLANILEGSTKRFFIFEVTTDQQQQGFPVAVEETEDGMKVDWRSFVEFHDNMLGRFINVYRQGPESFRVILERAHYFKTDVPDLGGKLAFRIKPPVPGFEGFAFCPKDTKLGEELDRKFAWDVKYLPIVELEWTKDEKGAKFIRILRVVQDNWRALQ